MDSGLAAYSRPGKTAGMLAASPELLRGFDAVVARQLLRLGDHVGNDLGARQEFNITRNPRLEPAPVGEGVEPAALEQAHGDSRQEGQALHHQHESEDVDLA